jgi:hypothetical protein
LSADPLTRPLLITAGLCTAFTFQSRQNTLLGGAVLALAILMSSQSLRRKLLDLAWVALGFGLGLAVLLMIVATWGDLRGYFYVVFVYPKNYAKATYQTLPQMIYSFGVLFKFLWVQVFGLILVILCCLLRFDKTFKKRRIPIFLAAATLSGIFICLAPLKAYSHYWASLVPFVALLAFAYLDERQSAPSRTGKLICAACAGYLVSLSLLSASYFAIATYTRGMRANLDKVVERVNSTAGKSDTLLVLGEQIEAAYVCYQTRPLPANPVFSSMQMEPYWSEILPKKFDVVFEEYLKAPPSIIVVGPHLSEGRPGVANQVRLLAALQKRWCYREDFSINKYKIFVKCN